MSGSTHIDNANFCCKIQYTSFREAQAVINLSKRHKYNDGQRVNRLMGRKDKQLQRSYKCEVCGFWHITSQKVWENV